MSWLLEILLSEHGEREWTWSAEWTCSWVNMEGYASFWIMAFSGYRPSSGVAGSYGGSCSLCFKESFKVYGCTLFGPALPNRAGLWARNECYVFKCSSSPRKRWNNTSEIRFSVVDLNISKLLSFQHITNIKMIHISHPSFIVCLQTYVFYTYSSFSWASHSANAVWLQVPMVGGFCAGWCGWDPELAPLPMHAPSVLWWVQVEQAQRQALGHKDMQNSPYVDNYIHWHFFLPFSTSWRRLCGPHSLPPSSHSPAPWCLEMATVTAAKPPQRLKER